MFEKPSGQEHFSNGVPQFWKDKKLIDAQRAQLKSGVKDAARGFWLISREKIASLKPDDTFLKAPREFLLLERLARNIACILYGEHSLTKENLTAMEIHALQVLVSELAERMKFIWVPTYSLPI